MSLATPYTDKTDEQKAICEMVRQFADEQIIPNAEHYDAADEFPEPIVEQMRELGLFGVTIPEEYGGMALDLTTYAMIVEELSRGWISISGIVNTHFIGSYLLMKFGTEEQRQKFLPRMATGEIRAAFSLSEPELGSDVQAIKTSAKRVDGDAYEINGQKMWVTNGLLSSLVFVLVKTDPTADPAPPRHDLLHRREGAGRRPGRRATYAGFDVPPKIKKLGYKGVESTELVFDGYRCPAENILGGEEAGLNRGFSQMMDALEVGRVNVAARGVGIAQRALELALKYAQERAHVRQADRRAPGDPVQARRHGDADRRGPAHDPARGADEGRRRALGARGRHGEALRLGDRPLLRRGVAAHPRRLRLLQGVRDRTALPRRAAAAHRRGDVRDPAHGHRAQAAPAAPVMSVAPDAAARGAHDAAR